MNKQKRNADIHFVIEPDDKKTFYRLLALKNLTASEWLRSQVKQFIRENI
jgi:hypothetical protein